MSTTNIQRVEQRNYDHGECAVCLVSPQESKSRMVCGHVFCFDCINRWGQTSKWECPLCKQPIQSFVTTIEEDNTILNLLNRIVNPDEQPLPRAIWKYVIYLVVDVDSIDLPMLLNDGPGFVRERSMDLLQSIPEEESDELLISFILANAPLDPQFHFVLHSHIQSAINVIMST